MRPEVPSASCHLPVVTVASLPSVWPEVPTFAQLDSEFLDATTELLTQNSALLWWEEKHGLGLRNICMFNSILQNSC